MKIHNPAVAAVGERFGAAKTHMSPSVHDQPASGHWWGIIVRYEHLERANMTRLAFYARPSATDDPGGPHSQMSEMIRQRTHAAKTFGQILSVTLWTSKRSWHIKSQEHLSGSSNGHPTHHGFSRTSPSQLHLYFRGFGYEVVSSLSICSL